MIYFLYNMTQRRGAEMGCYDFSALADMEFGVRFLSVNRTKDKPDKVFRCTKNLRKWDRFFYVSSGSICFDFDGKNLRADKGDIVYIPYDAAYLSEWQDENDIDYITTEFILCDLNGERFSLFDEIRIIASDKSNEYSGRLNALYNVWAKGEIGYRIKARALFFDLLQRLTVDSKKTDLRRSHRSIYKAIMYLENNYIDNISTDELARMCGMCQSSFRRLFHEYAGMSPIKYKNSLRAKKAAELLATGEYTVGEAAELVGIPDVAYFNRVFKQVFGTNPKDSKIK